MFSTVGDDQYFGGISPELTVVGYHQYCRRIPFSAAEDVQYDRDIVSIL